MTRSIPPSLAPAMARSRALRARAACVAAELQGGADVRAVVLYGSAARGSAGEQADIDLLVLLDGDVPARTSALLRRHSSLADPQVNWSAHTRGQLHVSRSQDWSFLAAVARDAVLLAGDESCLEWLASPDPGAEVTAGQIAGWRARAARTAERLRDRARLERGFAEHDEDDEAWRAAARAESVACAYAAQVLARSAGHLAAAAEGRLLRERGELEGFLCSVLPGHGNDISRALASEPWWREHHRGDPAGPLTAAQSRGMLEAADRVACALTGRLLGES